MNIFFRNKINIVIISSLFYSPLKLLFLSKLINQLFFKSISLLVIKIILIFNNLFLSLIFENWFLIELQTLLFLRSLNLIFIFFIRRLNTSLYFFFYFLIRFLEGFKLLWLSFTILSIWWYLCISCQSFFHWHIWLVYWLIYIFFLIFCK